jgi:hypothetical protein
MWAQEGVHDHTQPYLCPVSLSFMHVVLLFLVSTASWKASKFSACKGVADSKFPTCKGVDDCKFPAYEGVTHSKFTNVREKDTYGANFFYRINFFCMQRSGCSILERHICFFLALDASPISCPFIECVFSCSTGPRT